MNDDPTAEIGRLRRQLRAMSAVTRQIQAQLAAMQPTAQTRVRRAGQADRWLHDLEKLAQPVQVELLVVGARQIWLLEGNVRRIVKSSLLTLALEQELGPRRPIDASELEQWTEGPPVEVLETTTGPPFLIVGGQRFPLRGLPSPFPVPPEAAARFPQGPELDVWRATRTQGRTSGTLARLRSTRDLSAVAHEVSRRGKRQVRRLTGSGDS